MATLSQAFSVSSSIPATVSAVDFPGGLCVGGRSYPLVLRDPEPGVVYSLSVSNVQPNTASINFVQNSGGQPSGQIAIVNGTPTSFDVRVFAVGSCPPVTAVNFPPIRVPLGPTYCYSAPSAPEEPRNAPVVTLYPNPTNGLVSVQANQSVRYEWVKVTDVQGRLVLEQHAAGAEGISRFDLSKAPMGIFEVQLFDGKRLTQKRISKE